MAEVLASVGEEDCLSMSYWFSQTTSVMHFWTAEGWLLAVTPDRGDDFA
jgi:hypothetical protein